MNITYTEEALADILDAIAYLNERNPAAASNLDTDLAACIEHLAAGEFEGPVSRPPLRLLRAELARSAVSDLLPAPAKRTVDSADLPPDPPSDRTVIPGRRQASN